MNNGLGSPTIQAITVPASCSATSSAPLLDEADVRGATVADIGSGTGRIVDMLLAGGAAQVAAIEPSQAIDVLRGRFQDRRDRVTCHHVAGEHVDDLGPFDL